mgnify:FL=1
MDSKKYPDNIVYNYETGEFDAHKKAYPTSVNGQKFEPLKVDKSSAADANHYFESKLNELKEEYKKLINEYNWTSLVYAANYRFQPIVGKSYYLYEDVNKEKIFLSLIEPDQWKQKYIATFKLLNNGKWEKIS